jgi:hypothetical protein
VDVWVYCPIRLLQEELQARGVHVSTSTIVEHLKTLHSKNLNVTVYPHLSATQQLARERFVLDKADRTHGQNLHQHKLKVRVLPGMHIPGGGRLEDQVHQTACTIAGPERA